MCRCTSLRLKPCPFPFRRALFIFLAPYNYKNHQEKSLYILLLQPLFLSCIFCNTLILRNLSFSNHLIALLREERGYLVEYVLVSYSILPFLFRRALIIYLQHSNRRPYYQVVKFPCVSSAIYIYILNTGEGLQYCWTPPYMTGICIVDYNAL